MYAVAVAEPNRAVVARKEEPTKTRLVITTPMASYLRQNYIDYVTATAPSNAIEDKIFIWLLESKFISSIKITTPS
ncbi:hypothetical protein GPALN_015079 [Globodera pallida]|nr:hypothetical protein GPALN_015079 [Globodera pallida]